MCRTACLETFVLLDSVQGCASYFYSVSVAGHKPTAWVIEKLNPSCAVCILERGILAVVETEACKIIHDGGYIRVDGSKGTAEILKRAD